MHSTTCTNQKSIEITNSESVSNNSKLVTETTTTILSSESMLCEQYHASPRSCIPPAPPLPCANYATNTSELLNQYNLTSSQSEIKDSSIVITKSFLINSNTDENLDNSSQTAVAEQPRFENELNKKLKILNLIKKNSQLAPHVTTAMTTQNSHEEAKECDENDNVNELISISQIPSVMQTLDRQKTESAIKVNGLPASDPRRMTSFRSDFSTNILGSNMSTRSMLSEAKAKLEALSGKFNAGKCANSTNVARNESNSIETSASSPEKSSRTENTARDDEDLSDYIQTKF